MVTISKKTYVPVQNRGVPSTHYEICDGDTKIGTLSAFASNVGEHPYTNKPDKDIFYLGAFMIYREHRRKGYGRQILRKVKEDYKGKVLVLDAHAFDGLLQED